MLLNTAFAIVLATTQATPVPEYWGDLTPGPHPVGFSQRWIVDSTRRLPGDTLGLEFRPVLLNLWYPTQAAGGARMPYGDYFDGAARAAGAHHALGGYARALIAYNRRIGWRELAGAEPDSTETELRQRVEQLFRAPSAAYRDAPLPSGLAPVVVYTQGSQSSMDDNVVLCEYLASRGYLVIGSAFPREDNGGFSTSASDESRQRDIRRLLLEVVRMRGIRLGPVTAVGHSAGAQVMQLFTSDASAPIDAVVSLDATEDYAMLSDDTWAYYTEPLMRHRGRVRVPLMFVAGPEALFELADSLTGSDRWLVTVPNLRHNEFISQGIVRRRLLAGLPDDDPGGREEAGAAYTGLVRYIGTWLDARQRSPADATPIATPLVVHVATVPRGEGAPQLAGRDPRTAREIRHLFASVPPPALAGAVVRARAEGLAAGSDGVLMMLLVDAIRKGAGEHARAVYGELIARDSTVARVRDLIAARARLFERIQDEPLAAEWRGFLTALDRRSRSETGQ